MAKSNKKKNNWTWWLTVGVLIVTAGAILLMWLRSFRAQPTTFVRYPAFGIELPARFTIHGIDVSKHQGTIHWPAVKSMQVDDVRIGFVFIKATEGLGNVDRQFRRNWLHAGKAGLPRGAYHFFLATKSGRAQAKNFINTVKLQPGDLPPVLDVENLYGVKPEKMRKEVLAWLEEVEAHYGVKPIVYTYVNFYTRYLQPGFDDYPLWVAHYLEKTGPRINRPWMMWQHSERGRVNGIRNRVDFNVFNGDSSDFYDLLVK